MCKGKISVLKGSDSTSASTIAWLSLILELIQVILQLIR